MARRVSIAVAAVVLLVALTGSPAGAAGGGTKLCKPVKTEQRKAFHIVVQNMRCRTGRRVAEKVATGDRSPLGFTCERIGQAAGITGWDCYDLPKRMTFAVKRRK
jgi:hypothetical protein